ncbi:TRAP transporter substrate-binding protein DctP [Paralimibaculum aggregatum]|uniref:TRAP transporter substrate-binding protein DctP n=1 Tax=Paralimibaculum aggregatum TaxID=3036245 RepID=A0ABQ6LPH7_9RHOB|nr:TRAP transporter substrate-binding protein DctP [Limibaculum sp. NKW23]GMG83218.1 TRAP transporter substrate-binding protein DctP [Limibaculum sp. NKW23]
MTETTVARGSSRREFLRGSAVAGAATLAAPALATAQGATTTWRVQTAWSGGAGLETFRAWCASIVEKTNGQLAFEPLDPSNGVGGFKIYNAVSEGRFEAGNVFTIYSGQLFPAGDFLSSYPMAMRAPHEFDTFYYGLGGLELARRQFANIGLHYVGPVHHGPNIIHSKKMINRIDDFRGLRMRTPGGMVAELFQAVGAETVSLPGEKIFAALQSGEIDCADYVGPAINYDLGFAKETRFISMGPPGYMSVYQPVDLMDLTVNMAAWQALAPEMQFFLDNEVQAYSNLHHAAIQKADQEAWPKFEEAGTMVTRLSDEDVRLLTKLALPIWMKYAKRDAASTEIFKIQLDYMTSGSLGYVDKVMADFIAADL